MIKFFISLDISKFSTYDYLNKLLIEEGEFMLNEGPIGLTDREYKIMDILWDSERDLTINEISELSSDPKLSAPCV